MAARPDGQGEDPAALAAGLLEEEARRRQAERDRESTEESVLPDDVLPGVGSERMPLATVVRRGGIGTLAILTVLNFVDDLDRTAFAILAPDIQRSFDLSDAALGAVASVSGVFVVLAAVPIGYLADRARRTTLAGVFAMLWAAFTLLTGVVRQAWQLVVVRLLTGVGKGSILPVHNSLLSDTYPIEGRNRVFAVHNSANPAANIVGPITAGAVAALAGGAAGWRWAFLVAAAPTALVAVGALFLREPRRGRLEQTAILGEELLEQDDPPVSFAAARQRLLKIRTLYFLFVGVGVLGFALFGLPTFFNVLLEEEYGIGAFRRGVIGSLTQGGGLLGVPIGGYIGERLFRESPPKAIRLVALAVGSFGVVYPVALHLPGLVPLLAAVGIAIALINVGTVPIFAFIAAVSPFRLRSLSFALLGIYIFLAGGFLGGILTGVISDALGPRTALTIVAPVSALGAAGLIAYGSRFVRRDISLVVEELQEEQEELRRIAAADPEEIPLLQVRNLDFSYGQIQVLFDVGVDVRRGEVLALLGTNGAGKSTLLRAISGLGLPDRGVIRLDGRTITYTDAELRVREGIVQVPGGKAVFNSLTVEENLRAGAYQYVWDVERVRERIDRVVGLFPRLGERLDQPAGTLSGGEQQMLALGKALLLDPRILLIDELSLGLAPVIVQELLEVVEELKAEGITMVIVEQSLNVALAVADRAVFMERGEIRFEGSARELMERDDLARAVFLGGEGG